jgi:hypothetical protein
MKKSTKRLFINWFITIYLILITLLCIYLWYRLSHCQLEMYLPKNLGEPQLYESCLKYWH